MAFHVGLMWVVALRSGPVPLDVTETASNLAAVCIDQRYRAVRKSTLVARKGVEAFHGRNARCLRTHAFASWTLLLCIAMRTFCTTAIAGILSRPPEARQKALYDYSWGISGSPPGSASRRCRRSRWRLNSLTSSASQARSASEDRAEI